jgi:hypothetical protein
MRRARIRTDHGDAATARAIAAAVRPDNTTEMETRTDGSTVETTIERDTTGGLHSNADDYVVNLHVAAQLAYRPADTDTDASTTDTHEI